MDTFELVPGAFGGLAIADRSLQWIGDGEADDAERFLVVLVSVVDFLLSSLELCVGEGAALLSFSRSSIDSGCGWSPVTTFHTFFSESSIRH